MNIDIGKTIRISDFIDARDSRSLLVDTTIASCLGATRGLENLPETLKDINHIFDGIIINPGQAEHQAEFLGGKERAAPLIRVDWTNAFRDKNFSLPATTIKRIMISNGKDAFKLGASAVVASLFPGFDDDFEAKNIQSLSLLARECQQLSLPVVIDIRPIGAGVSESNFSESIKLGVSFMQELGADVLIIPECDFDTCQVIANWISVPVLLRIDQIPSDEKMDDIFKSGLAGIVLTESIFADENVNKKLIMLKSKIHEKRK